MATRGASRLFLDANVLISALRGPGVCEDLLMEAARDHYSAVVSWFVLAETAEVLARKFRTPAEDVRDALAAMRLQTVTDASIFAVRQAASLVTDADDAPVLAAALQAKVDALVTGDAHFFAPAVQARIRVLTPREALDMVRGGISRAESEGDG